MLRGLGLALHASPGPRQLGAVLRASIGDPTAEVLVRDRQTSCWRHDDGRPVDEELVAADGRVVREIRDARGPVAALVLGAELDPDDELVEAIVSVMEAALRETRLQRELDVSRSDLDDSRKRIATAADVERRRIERDLHDGAQQRLIALRMRLSLIEDLVAQDPAAAEAIRALELDVDRALEEIRSLAHGIYPALLATEGSGTRCRASRAGRCCPSRWQANGLTRHPPEVETAVYFSCLEALQNAIKHGQGVTHVRMRLRQNHVLAFEVIDDGAGFDPAIAPAGAGIASMHDRVESLGGRLTVDSAPGRGTVVRGTLPLSAHAPDQPSRVPSYRG